MKNSKQSDFKNTNTNPEFSQEGSSYDTLIKLNFHCGLEIFYQIETAYWGPFLNPARNFLWIETEILIFLTIHSVFHQWDKWILIQLTYPASTMSQRLCEVDIWSPI